MFCAMILFGSKVSFCTKYNVLNVQNLLNATTFQGYFSKGTYTALEFCIYAN